MKSYQARIMLAASLLPLSALWLFAPLITPEPPLLRRRSNRKTPKLLIGKGKLVRQRQPGDLGRPTPAR